MEKKSRKKKNRQQNQRNHLPLLQSFTISEVMWKQDSYSALNLQEFHPNFRGWTPALSSTCVFWLLFHSRINLPVTFSIKLWNCAEAINPDHQLYGWGKMPSSPLVLGYNHRTPPGSGSISLETLLGRVKMSIFNGKIRTGKSGEKMGSKKECTKQEKGREHADLFLTKHQPDRETGGDPDPWEISAKRTPKDAQQENQF